MKEDIALLRKQFWKDTFPSIAVRIFEIIVFQVLNFIKASQMLPFALLAIASLVMFFISLQELSGPQLDTPPWYIKIELQFFSFIDKDGNKSIIEEELISTYFQLSFIYYLATSLISAIFKIKTRMSFWTKIKFFLFPTYMLYFVAFILNFFAFPENVLNSNLAYAMALTITTIAYLYSFIISSVIEKLKWFIRVSPSWPKTISKS